MTKSRFAQRYIELDAEFQKIPFVRFNNDIRKNQNGEWRTRATSAENLIAASFGAKSIHSNQFSQQVAKCETLETDIRHLHAIFSCARQDFEGGYQFKVELLVSGEIFGDFVRLAQQALSEGHKDVAAVLASAALEDALKKFALLNEIILVDATMQEVINSLKAKGLVGGAQKTLIDSMPRIRNHSLHAEWDKITETEVGSVIGFVEQFLLTKFSPE